MKTAMFFLLLALSAGAAINHDRLADAIHRAEGGAKARVPYGILSVRVRGDARAICLRTIRNRLKVWDGRGCVIEFIGRKYCPPQADPVGHRNWVRNVRRIYHAK